MPRYASQTVVPVEQSRAEIERILTRYGADQFLYGWDRDKAVIRFRASGRHVSFVLPLPDKDDTAFTIYKRGYTRYERTEVQALQRWEQACRQRWRALALVIKAKLEAVESGITDFESEFLAHIILPSGETVGAWLAPQIDHAYNAGEMPAGLAPMLSAGDSSPAEDVEVAE